MAENVIYKCSEKHLQDVVRIANESFRKQRAENDFRKHVGKFFYVLTVNDTVRGFVLVDDNYLKLIAVEKKYRKRGYGKKLMNFILGCTSGLRLRVRATNESAIEFYEHFGFAGLDRIHGYYANGDDALEMIYGKGRTY